MGELPAGRSRTTFSDAQLAERGPAIPLGSGWTAPAPRMTRGPCWVRYDAVASTADAAFVARNGPEWLNDDLRVDSHFGVVIHASRASQERVEPAAPPSVDGLAQRARAFVRANADLLGLVERDFDQFAWVVASETSAPISVDVSASPMASIPPPPFPEIARRASVYLTLRRGGEIVHVLAQISPEVPVCTRARVTPEEAIGAQGILGRVIGRSSKVTRGDLGPPTLTIDVDGGPYGLEVLRYRLVYDMAFDSGPQSFIVDAMTGHLLGFITKPIP
jgi:hypothetical protein